MLILTIRTDKPEAEIGLYDNGKQVTYETWYAHRQLSETLHKKIEDLLTSNNFKWADISGIACYKGPGSFTGLRIGITVGNALAESLSKPIVSESGDDWVRKALKRLSNDENEHVAQPNYGREAHITQPK